MSRSGVSGLLRGAVYAVGLALIWSFPLWLVGRGIGQRVSLVSLDLVLLLLAVVFLPRRRLTLLLALLLLPVLFLFDFVAYGPTGVSLRSAMSEGLQSLQTLPTASRLLVMGLPVLGLLCTVAGGLRWARWRPGAFVVLAALAVTWTVAGRWVPPSLKVLRSGLYESSKIVRKEPELFRLRTGLRRAHAQLQPGYSLAEQHLAVDTPAVLIMVESLGVPQDDEAAFVHQWSQHLAQARTCGGRPMPVQSGVRDSGYFTIDAEFRELCSMSITGFYPVFDPAQCLPGRWTNAVAFHNNSWAFYSRKSLYKQMGFKTFWARENLGLAGDPLTPFGAVPDAAVAEKVIEAAQQQPGLYYWMTLDLHSPYDSRRITDRTVQGSLQVYKALLASQLDLYSRMVSALPSYRFLFVGDHTPKFFDGNDGRFQSGRVPYFVVPPCL